MPVKSPKLTLRKLAANRANGKKSTGPRTAPGKARSRFNGLAHGWRSKTGKAILSAMWSAPPGHLRDTLDRVLTPGERNHPCFRRFIEVVCRVPVTKEFPAVAQRRGTLGERRTARLEKIRQAKPGSFFLQHASRNEPVNLLMLIGLAVRSLISCRISRIRNKHDLQEDGRVAAG